MNQTLERHPDEGAMIRVIDGVLEPDEVETVGRHVQSCASCMSRLEQLRLVSRSWTSALDLTDGVVDRSYPSVPEPIIVRAWLSRAWLMRAAVLILAVGMFGIPSVRAAVSNVWQRLLGESTPAAEIESTAITQDVMTLAFPFDGATFELSFDSPQAMGEVFVTFGKAERVRVRVENGRGTELLVQPAGMHVRNTARSTASYRIDLPRNVQAVRVIVAGQLARRLEAANGFTIELPIQP